ncbi:MAG: TIM barrel protein [Pirellulales bacterium]|nr:TIM barrel protein [Pirellulales bacterium]
MITLGFHTDNWRPLSLGFEAAVDKGRALGMRHVEFAVLNGQNFIQAMGYDPGISLQSNGRALKRYLDGRGMTVSQIDGAYPLMGPLGSTFGVHYVQQAIRFAAEIGCPIVDTTDGAFEIEGFSRDEVFRVTCDNYRQCLGWAEDYGIVLAVEPHGPYTNDGDFMQKLFDHFDSEHLRFNLDTGNSFIAGLNPLEYCKRFRKYLVHAHVKDVSPELAAAVRGEETGIGSSIVPIGGGVNAENIRRVFAYLNETGWDGVVSIECHGSDDNMKASVDFLRALPGVGF